MYSVAIISDIHDWHSQQLETNLKKIKCKVIKMKYDELSAHFSKKRKYNFNDKLKNIDGIWTRFIKNGSLEEITTKLTFLHLLKKEGIYIHNSAEVIEKTVDKVRTTGLLELSKVCSPETIVKIGNIKKLNRNKNYLVKPIFGSQGKNIVLVKNQNDLKKIKLFGNVSYIQEFLGNINQSEHWDIRILVSNHKPIAIMKRLSSQIITNAYKGAVVKKFKINKKLIGLSKKVSELFQLGYGGIDVKLFENHYYVLEVNSIPSWKSIQSIESKNLSMVLVKDFIKKVKENVS